MTLLAVGWKTCTTMVGIIGGLVVVEVATDAIGGGSSVDAARVAGRTVQRRVHAIQGERMIEVRILPRAIGPVVAEIAGRGETRSAMVRIGGGLVVVQVAADTVPGCPRVDTVTVASRAVGGRVLATQAVLVIENSLIPRDIVGMVADIALRRETRGHVV